MTPDPETTARHALTPMQARVLDAIRSYVLLRGYPPTLRELGDRVGIGSPSSVSYQLGVLARYGYIERDPSKPRAIRVLEPGTVLTPIPGGAE